MFHSLLILNSKCESIITQHYKHQPSPLDSAIFEFKSQLSSNRNDIDDNQCVKIINMYSFIFIKYNDIIICIITGKNINVFNILSFEYELMNTIQEYIGPNKNKNDMTLTSSKINDNIVLVLEILNEMIFDGYPQPIFDEKYLIHKKPIKSVALYKLQSARQCSAILCQITGAVPWRAPTTTMGFSVGGSKDVNNFRDCIKKQIAPNKSSLTYNGLFYDYYFKNINHQKEGSDNNDDDHNLFYPSYCYAKCKEDYYISVGLNSNIKSDEFKRNKLNLMIVLDISGSMKAPFTNDMGRDSFDMIDNELSNKIDIAKHCLINLVLNHIDKADNFCILLFNHNVRVLQEFESFQNINKDELIHKIKQITASGGTELGNAYQNAVKLFDNVKDLKNNSYDNRIIYLTDARQNLGYSQCKELIDLSKIYSSKSLNDGRICTTFIGIGIDFDTDLIHNIASKLYGCNYFAVHSLKEFQKRMTDEFDLMVTPLIFNLKLEIKSEGNNYKIHKIYGKENDNDSESGILLNVKTLFPSQSNAENEVKGGLILVKIRAIHMNENDLNLEFKVNYEDRFGQRFGNQQFVSFDRHSDDEYYYDNNGIQKAILLIQYIDLLKEWINTNKNGLFFVSKMYRHRFEKFLKHFVVEMQAIKDKTLEKEIKILTQLIECKSNVSNIASLNQRNQVSLQVTEKINVLINNKYGEENKILLAKCNGSISMNSSLIGMPTCKLGLFVGKNIINECEWKYHQCIRLNLLKRDRLNGMRCLTFVPPNGLFHIIKYAVNDYKCIDIPFNIIHNIKHSAFAVNFDIILKHRLEANEMANDIIIKVPLSTDYNYVITDNVIIKTKYGKCELKEINKNACLVWYINKLYSSQYPRLSGRVNLNKFAIGTRTSYDRRRSISLQFKMSKRLSTCFKVMYLNVVEPKYNYKTQSKIEYMLTTDETDNIKYKI